MEDAMFAIFLVCGFIWMLMGAPAVIALFKADGQPIRFGKVGLLVSIPILIPVIAALTIAAVYR